MRAFSQLYSKLDASTSTNAKIEALKDYFSTAAPGDSAWAVYFLAGGRPRQTVPTRLLRSAALRESGLPEWLFEECYQAVGDLAETITLVLPPADRASDEGLAFWIETRLLGLRGASPEAALEALAAYWRELDRSERFLLIKLIGGGFRVGVSKLLVTRALAESAGIDPKQVAQRLMGYTDARQVPSAQSFLRLIDTESLGSDGVDASEGRAGQPYPFFLAHALPVAGPSIEEVLGAVTDWLVEWKYDGIRGQFVKRASASWLWSRGEELVNERFPELIAIGAGLPDGCVLDGEIVVWQDNRPGSFALLQQRIGRKNVTAKVLREAPAAFIAYDVLEWGYQDCRGEPLSARRVRLEQLIAQVAHPALRLSPEVEGGSWKELQSLRERSRERHVEGFMLKQRSSRYGVGRTKESGLWWKWKVEPFSVDAVLLYAQRGHGRRASLYTDFTFAVWDKPAGESGRSLVPFAKAYSGLTDEEMKQVDAIVRKTTVEKFGPVRSVLPSLVFELGFEGIAASPRHKSGIAVRFPRMLRWRLDKGIEEADTLASLVALLASTQALADDA
jgi:DNA ligase-1